MTISDEETHLTLIRVQSIGRVDRKVVAIKPMHQEIGEEMIFLDIYYKHTSG